MRDVFLGCDSVKSDGGGLFLPLALEVEGMLSKSKKLGKYGKDMREKTRMEQKKVQPK